MEKIIFSNKFFNITDTLFCGQTFRFTPFQDGYLVFTGDKACYAKTDEDNTIIEFEDGESDYFYNYFDLDFDYEKVYNDALSEKENIIRESAMLAKGVRILRQDKEEILFSFIVSQNNHIPRIKAILKRISENLGEKKTFKGVTYYTFPKADIMAEKDVEFYSKLGLGYRDQYIKRVSESIKNGFNLNNLDNLDTLSLKKELMSLHGIGPKVADCVTLFGFHRMDSFPVDTWIEKVYKTDFCGTLTDRNKITQYFLERFKNNSGIIQQYLFYYKRSLENKM